MYKSADSELALNEAEVSNLNATLCSWIMTDKIKKIVFIINPNAGTGNKNSVVSAIEQHLDKKVFEPEIRYTEYAGHAAIIAREEAQKGTDVVVAVGGDGTVNEVGRALVGTQTAMAIIPCGSGNGLARHMRISMQPSKAVKLINDCCVKDIDYGMVNDNAFFCTCGVGFDAFISMKFAEAGSRGLKTYVEKTLQDGLTYKPETYRIEIDGETEVQEAFLIACANASQYGNNAYIAPEASTRDGLMDVTILTPFTPLESAQIVMQMFSRELSKNSHVKTFRTKRIKIMREHEGPAHVDGDPMMMGNTLDVEIVPASLHMVVNGKPGHRPVAFPVIHSMRRELLEVQRELGTVQRDIEQTLFRSIIEPFHIFEKKDKNEEG